MLVRGKTRNRTAYLRPDTAGDPRMTAQYAHVVDMAQTNPALFIPVKVG